jgi:WD40 repeat protein
MPEVLIESINENALNIVGDTILVGGGTSGIPEIYEDYTSIFLEPISIYFKDLLEFQKKSDRVTVPGVERLEPQPLLPQVITAPQTQRWRCIHTLNHAATVAIVTSDGKAIASGGKDGKIKLWNLATGELLTTLSGHSSAVESIAITPDGQILASGSADSTIKLWKLTTGELLDTLSAHSSAVRSVAISPDGKILASGSYDKSIKLWDISKRALIRTLQGVSSLVSSITFSPRLNPKILAAGIQNGQVLQWDLKADSSPTTLLWNSTKVESMSISPDSNTLIVGDSDGIIKVLNLYMGVVFASFPSHQGSVLSVAISRDGKTLLSGGNDIKLWNLDSHSLLEAFSEHTSKVCTVDFSPSGEQFISSSQDETIKVWQYE